MPVELMEHNGRHYAVLFHYALPDDAWRLELSEAVPAPASWAGTPGAERFLHGPAVISALVPDEDPAAEPTVRVWSPEGERVVPYEVMRWFMDHVAREVLRCRGAMAAGGGAGS